MKVRIHPTFIALLVLCALGGLLTRALLVFGLVILHEIVHILVAKGFGVKLRSVELYPYGGTAVLEDSFEGKKVDESIIAFAGPAFNFLLFIIFQYLRWEGILQGSWTLEFVKINFWLACFNLIPVLPLDGGRMVRAFLAGTFGFVKTTKFLAVAGKVLGGIFIVSGFFLQAFQFVQLEPVLFIVLGVFFWIGSDKELKNARIVFLKQLCRKKERLLSRGLMPSRCLTVNKDTPLSEVVNEFTTDRYSIVSVIGAKDKLEHTLSETEVVQGLLDKGLKVKIRDLI
ncbi:MAG: peptidase M50 [Peptococcaceae bacterium]|nr:peptidase M50 [Peptococcaceae bacterium]